MTRDHSRYRTILGIRFFVGTVHEAIAQMNEGGLLVVPAAPALKDLPTNPDYREALLGADLAIADSALMTIIWNSIARDKIRRISGLLYLKELLGQPEFSGSSPFWIMASPHSAARNLEWLRSRGISVPDKNVYIAPVYDSCIQDVGLITILHQQRPEHIVITIGGGTQERLGLYLKRGLDYKPAIHCIGAAIAFLSGDQVRIPGWADRCYLGWLFRCIASPRRFIPRYWAARKLLPLMLRYRHALPAERP